MRGRARLRQGVALATTACGRRGDLRLGDDGDPRRLGRRGGRRDPAARRERGGRRAPRANPLRGQQLHVHEQSARNVRRSGGPGGARAGGADGRLRGVRRLHAHAAPRGCPGNRPEPPARDAPRHGRRGARPLEPRPAPGAEPDPGLRALERPADVVDVFDGLALRLRGSDGSDHGAPHDLGLREGRPHEPDHLPRLPHDAVAPHDRLRADGPGAP